MTDWESSSMVRVLPPARPRTLAKVPFVELADGRLQGVVSSGSDIGRVYVSSVSAGSYEFACSTNNNRPCGGARGTFCKHIATLIDEAALQYGVDRVARYLRVDVTGDVSGEQPTGRDIAERMRDAGPSRADGTAAAAVFSQFLRHLTYLEHPPTTSPVPELHWFATTGAVR